MCTCGHSFEEHHHGVIMNNQALIDRGQEFRNVHGVLGEECEYSQFEGVHMDGKEPCNCQTYWDINWPAKQ